MNTLDEILPPPATLANPLSGEVIDRDDLNAIVAALAETDEWLNDWHRQKRPLYELRDRLRVRRGELSPVPLPARRNQTDKQQRLERCPACRTPLPRTHIEEPE